MKKPGKDIFYRNVIIIGGGPSGISASLQLRKSDISSLIIEKKEIGGLLRNAWNIENYPGFSEGISGHNIVELFKKQLLNFECEYFYDEIVKIDSSNNKKWFLSGNRYNYLCDYIIMACGTKPIVQNGLSNSPSIFFEVADCIEQRNKNIAVIGSGDAAFDYSLSLYDAGNSPDIYMRGDIHKCNSGLWNEFQKRNLNVYRNYNLKSIIDENDRLKLNFDYRNELTSKEYDLLLFAIGRVPQDDLVAYLDKSEIGKTVYLTGDMVNGSFRQSAISIGQGVKAAMDIYVHMHSLQYFV